MESSSQSLTEPSATRTRIRSARQTVELLASYQIGGEDVKFTRRAIDSLVKKFKERPVALGALVKVITEWGSDIGPCIDLTTTLDGRLQIVGRKVFPYVLFCKIWRWDDVSRRELSTIPECHLGFQKKTEEGHSIICINPYHYQRNAVSCSTEVKNEKSEPESVVNWPQRFQVDFQKGFLQNPSFDPSTMLPEFNSESSVPFELDSGFIPNVNPFDDSRVPHDLGYFPTPPSSQQTMSQEPSQPSSSVCTDYSDYSSCSVGYSGCSMVTEDTFELSEMEQSPVAALCANNGCETMEELYQNALLFHPNPELWCTLTYFELNKQIGEAEKAAVASPTFHITGNIFGRFRPNMMCLGAYADPDRCPEILQVRQYIAQGVELFFQRSDGSVWLRVLNKCSIYVQSHYLDRINEKPAGGGVYKMAAACGKVKVFDLRDCFFHMLEEAEAYKKATKLVEAFVDDPDDPDPLPTTGAIPVDHFRPMCTVKFSFMKGFGPGYPRQSIKETPCWIEAVVYRALQLCDEIIVTSFT